MEPIRSDSKRGVDRRPRSRSSLHETAGEGFARRLEQPAAESDASHLDPIDPSVLADLPPIDAPVQRLYDAVHEAGQRLLQERTYSATQHYRESIRRFLRKVLPDANTIVVQESHKDILTRKRYYLVTSINRSVDRLVTGLLQTQSQQLDILHRLEEIEGMLVDLMQ